MSRSGAMPSSRTPSTSPVNGSGVVPLETVWPVTGCPAVSSAIGYAAAQSPAGGAEAAGDTAPSVAPASAVAVAARPPRRAAVLRRRTSPPLGLLVRSEVVRLMLMRLHPRSTGAPPPYCAGTLPADRARERGISGRNNGRVMTSPGRVAVAATGEQALAAGLGVADDGGNAVDAAMAAAFVALSTEPGMVSFGGGAFVSVWPVDGDPVVVDGNVEMPGRGAPASAFGAGVREVVTEYGGGVVMHAGAGSVATPGIVPAFATCPRSLRTAAVASTAATGGRGCPARLPDEPGRLALPRLHRRLALRRGCGGARAGHRARAAGCCAGVTRRATSCSPR